MLSTNEPCPVRSLRSSLRATLWPIQVCVPVAAISRPHGLDGLDDVDVARAAAEVALERLADLLLARRRILLEQRDRRHHHPRRAVAALEAVLRVERLLHLVHRAVREALDRRHLAPVCLDREQRA